MFTVYHSNQLDLLKSLTAHLVKRQPLDSVFAQEVILVQSQGMSQWLQIQLANELGIAANIDFPFPNQFVWDIYRIFYPDLPTTNVLDCDFMTWVLLARLPELIKLPRFATLKHYFNRYTDDQQKYYQLANSIAQLFDQYLVYRVDWLKTWETGQLVDGLDKSQEWQAALWQEVVSYIKELAFPFTHRADIHMAVIDALNHKNLNQQQINKLPKRFFIFGIVSLPPLYLALFHSLSQYIDVHFMFMNPCRQYWGDIVDHAFLNKHFNTDQTLDIMVQETNPLLASWGKQGRDYLALLQNYTDKNDIELFADYDNPTLLSLVKQAILDLQNEANQANNIIGIDNGSYKQLIAHDDHSIELHACHSEQREVEVLYDHLLAIFDQHPDISLNDCVVMVADIDHYAPYIQAVFDNAPKQRYLPYTVADQKLKYIDPIVQGFFLLLDLPQSRLEIEYIFDLLDIPAIAQRFALNQDNLNLLRTWIVDSGIRWGLESGIDEPHSWLIGLNRMLLGYIMESQLDSWQGLFPYDVSTGLDAELVGFLSDFIMTIAKWRTILSQPHPINIWQTLGSELLADFFLFENHSEPLLLMITEEWQHIIKQAESAHYDAAIDVIILKNLIQSKFDNHFLSHRFLIGKINFCTMMPMRSVPFKVVCLLGMNDGVYPRVTTPLGFDLISHHGRLGDRSRRNDDRYLFLEALLSAEQKLYISYIGRDIQTNDERYPSILVDELLAHLQQSYVLSGDELLPLDISIAKFNQHLIHYHTRMPFNMNNYLPTSEQTLVNKISYADEWLPAAKQQGQSNEFYQLLNTQPMVSIALDDLKHFYFHPIKELAKKRLGYLIGYTDEQLPDTEKFNLDGLQRHRVNNQILELFMLQDIVSVEMDHKLYQKMLHSNQLPYGAFGHILYSEQKALMQNLLKQIKEHRHGEFLSLDVTLPIHHIELVGRIKNIQADGILQWSSAKLTIRQGIGLWIDHLIFCLLQSEQHLFQNRMFGRDETKWSFNPLPANDAFNLLTELVMGMIDGYQRPLFMPLQSSWRWIETAYDPTTQDITEDQNILSKARNNFVSQWHGGKNINAECDDYYYRLYPQLTDELIDSAIISIRRYLLPIMQYRYQEK